MSKRKVLFNDVALRESAQVDGGAMTPRDQKTYISYLLEGGIDRIEIGFPGSSSEQLAQCQDIVEFVKNNKGKYKPLLSGLARASKADIKAVRDAGCDICHIYIPSSGEFISAMFDSEKYGNTQKAKQEWVIDQAVKMVNYAKSIGFELVEYSPEDAARTSLAYLCRIVEAVISAGASIVNIPDTTGLRIGSEFGDIISKLFLEVPNINDAQISVHCHNDSDHSTHNALQAVLAGATIIEGTFYGLGERSGMTKFESILMNVYTRSDVFEGIEIRFEKTACVKVVNFIAKALGMPVPRHWPVVGKQNAICSSGTHQAIEAKVFDQSQGYYSWNPSFFGHEGVSTVLNQSSGRAGLKRHLKEIGYVVTKEQLNEVYQRVIQVSEAKDGRAVDDREIAAIVQDVIAEIPFSMTVKQCQAVGGTGTIPQASVVLEINGNEIVATDNGNGPIEAVMKSVIKASTKHYPILEDVEIVLEDWNTHAITSGAEALADAYARIRVTNGHGDVFTGRSVNIDTIQASAQAFANCISWCLNSLNL